MRKTYPVALIISATLQSKPVHVGLMNGHKTNGSLLDRVHTVAAVNYEEFLSGSHDNTIALWNSVTGERVRTFIGHTKPISKVQKFNDNLFFSISWQDGTAKLWNIHTGECVKTFVSEKGPFRCLVKMSKSTIAAIVARNTVELWDTENNVCIRTFLDVHTGRQFTWSIEKMAAAVFATSTGVGVVAIWNTNQEACQHSIQLPRGCLVVEVLSGEENTLLTCSTDGRVRLWEIHTGTCLDSFRVDGGFGYSSVARFSRRLCLSVDGNGQKVRLWDVVAQRLLHTFESDRSIRVYHGITVHHMGELESLDRLNDASFVTGHDDGTLKVWKIPPEILRNSDCLTSE